VPELLSQLRTFRSWWLSLLFLIAVQVRRNFPSVPTDRMPGQIIPLCRAAPFYRFTDPASSRGVACLWHIKKTVNWTVSQFTYLSNICHYQYVRYMFIGSSKAAIRAVFLICYASVGVPHSLHAASSSILPNQLSSQAGNYSVSLVIRFFRKL
jgi:hypothetical protein